MNPTERVDTERTGDQWSCVACGGLPAPKTLIKDGFSYRICVTCALASLYPLPSEAAATALYGHGYFDEGADGGYSDYEADEALHRRNARWRLRTIARRRGPETGTLLDLGCATGFFLSEASNHGWSVVGMDVSSWARERVQQRFAFDVFPDLRSLERDLAGAFDVVCLSQVLEHTVNPQEMLRAAHRCLRPGGLVFVETWDRGSVVARLLGTHWQQVTPPSVVHLFSRRGLDELLARSGFDSCRQNRAIKFVSVHFVGNLLAKKYPRFSDVLETTSRGSAGRRALPYFFGDLVHATALRGEESD